MKIKINIIKTETGYDFRNAESGIITAFIREGRNKPGIYLWHITYGEYGFDNIEQAIYTVKEILSQRAANLGCEIEFINNNEDK